MGGEWGGYEVGGGEGGGMTGRWSLLGGGGEPPGHAEVVTFATGGTRLDFWAHYAARGEGGISPVSG